MTIARAHLVDPAVSRWYQGVIRCVRRAFLRGGEHEDRKTWIERRPQELGVEVTGQMYHYKTRIFAICPRFL